MTTITPTPRRATTGFHPDEVLFSPTTACNLACRHCDVTRTGRVLSAPAARRFLSQCRKLGVQRVGFTGGEPFLCLDFLCRLSRHAVKEGLLFDRIMTNGVWWRNERELASALTRLYRAGYDGAICVSVDAFHNQPPLKVARFITRAVAVWGRPDAVSIARTLGMRDRETRAKVNQVLARVKRQEPDAIVRVVDIALAPVGRAARVKTPWADGAWFVEDYCQGPGNVFAVMPDGRVAPCCGYANERPELTIGNLHRDSAAVMLKRARTNRLVRTIFTRGLSAIRRQLERRGVRFPGKTRSHCAFCHYILSEVPREILMNVECRTPNVERPRRGSSLPAFT